jgi:hypothetical protein
MKSLPLALALLSNCAFGQIVAPKPKPPVGVPSDAQFFGGNWFRFYTEKTAWSQARDKCKTLGGHLAITSDAATWDFVKVMTGQVSVWLGATDEITVGAWKWVDGTPVTFTAWYKGQPDNGRGIEHYLATYKAEWNDAPKNGEFMPKQFVCGYVCEWAGK